MNNLINISGDHLETLRERGGYYECPKDSQGFRLGPLVGYNGTYPSPYGEKAWVGDVYVNFAMAEEYPCTVRHFASSMQEKLDPLMPSIDSFCGFPIGGYGFSQMLALFFKRQAIKGEKEAIVTADMLDVREQYKLVFHQHTIEEGARYAIVTDICNNFSKVEEFISLIMLSGGTVAAIVCFLNRSMYFEDCYPSTAAGEVPIISLIRKPILQYRQDNPEVVDDIRNGNIVWDPEACWPQLMQVMQDNSR